MKTIRMALTGVLFVLPMTGLAAQLDSSALRAKTFKAIDNVVSAESYPQKCIIKYSISSTSKKGSPAINMAARRKLVMDALDAGKSMEEMEKIVADLDKPEPAVVTEQLTATLKYKAAGVVHEDVILDLEASAESPQALFKNMADVVSSFADRNCDQSATPKEAAAPSAQKYQSILVVNPAVQ
jgi:hypothetical protein